MPEHRLRRLPGFRFEVQAPPLTGLLPRMDVACFVGFAASGPLHRPVPVASIPQFEMIFGKDMKLAWDEIRGEPVYAYLAPVVRAFFRNGGRQAWIIRVAGEATTTYFPVSSLLQVVFDDQDNIKEIRPAYAQARSPGSWPDAVRVSTSLMSRSVGLVPVSFGPPQFDVSLTAPGELVVGDLLRLTFDSGTILICAVKSIEPDATSPLRTDRRRIICDKAVWFKPAWQQPPLTLTGQAYLLTHDPKSDALNVTVPVRSGSPLAVDWPTKLDPSPVKLDLDVAPDAAPQLGSMLRPHWQRSQ